MTCRNGSLSPSSCYRNHPWAFTTCRGVAFACFLPDVTHTHTHTHMELCNGPAHIRAESNVHHKPFVFLGSKNSISGDYLSLWFPIPICRDIRGPSICAVLCRSQHKASARTLHSGQAQGLLWLLPHWHLHFLAVHF